MDINDFKFDVKAAAEHLAKSGHTIPHTLMMEAMSKSFGARNWSNLRHYFAGGAETKAAVAPALEVEPEWSVDMGMMSDTQYTRKGGECCPACGASDVEASGIDADGPQATEDNKCFACFATWTSHYRITGYSGLSGSTAIRPDVVQDLFDDVVAREEKHGFKVSFQDAAMDALHSTNELLGLEATDAELSAACEKLTTGRCPF